MSHPHSDTTFFLTHPQIHFRWPCMCNVKGLQCIFWVVHVACQSWDLQWTKRRAFSRHHSGSFGFNQVCLWWRDSELYSYTCMKVPENQWRGSIVMQLVHKLFVMYYCQNFLLLVDLTISDVLVKIAKGTPMVCYYTNILSASILPCHCFYAYFKPRKFFPVFDFSGINNKSKTL